MSAPRRVLIAGCGDVGTALARRLLEDGHKVWAMRRSNIAVTPGVQTIVADLTNPATLTSLPHVDDVFFTASADERTEESYRAIYVDGLRNVLSAYQTHRTAPERLFYTSSTAVYGQDDGSWIDESSPTEPRTFSGRILKEAEQIVWNAPWTGMVVRLSGIYGPGRTRFVKRVASGQKPLTPRYTNRIHVEDCGGMLRHLAALERVDSLYVGVDHAPVTEIEVGEWIAHRLQVPAHTNAREDVALNKRCRNRRLVDTGYTFTYPTYREGYAPIVNAFAATRSETTPSDG